MRKLALLALLLMTLGFFTTNNVSANTTGTININLQDSANADVSREAWTLHAGTNTSGTVVQSSKGDATLYNMPTGSYYLVTTSNTANYKTVTVSSTNPQTLTSTGTISFNVLYTLQPASGSISIDLVDDAGAAVTNETWSLYSGSSESASLFQSGKGNRVINNVANGTYFLKTTSNYGNYYTVEVISTNPQTVSTGNTIAFKAMYKLRNQTGTVVVEMHNDVGLKVSNGVWTLHSGTSASGRAIKTSGGSASIPNLPAGSYYLETNRNDNLYESVTVSPSRTQTLTAGNVITFKVTYAIDSTITSDNGKISRIFSKRRREIFHNFHMTKRYCKVNTASDRATCNQDAAKAKNTTLRAVQAEQKEALKNAKMNNGN